MGTLVHVQLYTFSYRKPVIRPQNTPKTADLGGGESKLWYFKMAPQVQPKCFWHPKHMRNNWQTRLSHQVWSHGGSTLFSSCRAETDPYMFVTTCLISAWNKTRVLYKISAQAKEKGPNFLAPGGHCTFNGGAATVGRLARSVPQTWRAYRHCTSQPF